MYDFPSYDSDYHTPFCPEDTDRASSTVFHNTKSDYQNPEIYCCNPLLFLSPSITVSASTLAPLVHRRPHIMGQTMQLPPPTSSKGYWELTGHLYVFKTPDSNIGAEYVLFDGPGPRGQEVNMDIRFSGPDSPFTYSGSVWLGPGPPSDDASQFKIEGKGVKVNGNSEPERESTFKIVAGSGKGLYSGINGGGKLVVLLGNPSTRVYGNCVFRNMNSVGAALM